MELNWIGLNLIEFKWIELNWLSRLQIVPILRRNTELDDRDWVAKSSPMSSDGNKSMIQDETPDEGPSDGRHEGKRRADDDCGRSNDEPHSTAGK